MTEMSEPGGAVVEWVTYDVYGLPRSATCRGPSSRRARSGTRTSTPAASTTPRAGSTSTGQGTTTPATGRFLQRDPLGYSAGASLYLYAAADPITLADPLGLEEKAPAVPKHATPLKIHREGISHAGAQLDQLVKDGVITETEAQRAKDTLAGSPGATIARISAYPLRCRRKGKSLDVWYHLFVEVSVIITIDPQTSGVKDHLPDHEQGHVNTAESAAEQANTDNPEGIKGGEKYETEKEAKARQAEIEKGEGAKPVQARQKRRTSRQRRTRPRTQTEDKGERDKPYHDAVGKSGYPDNPANTEEQNEALRKCGAIKSPK